MVSARPAALKYIELTGTKLIASEFREINKLVPNLSGHTTFSIKLNPQFTKNSGDEFPSQIVQNVEIVIRAFLGDDSSTEDVGSNELAYCKVLIALSYKIKKPSFTEQNILEHQWFFHSQAVLASRAIIKNILRNTDYSDMPIPYDYLDDIQISDSPKK